MRLKTPSAPFSPVCVVGESITVDTAGKVLVLPSGNPDILPAHNEYVLSSRRLSLEDYPWGGVSDFPDFLPGTLYTPTDGIYLSDIYGTNSTKTLTAGKLAELGDLSVDTTNHTITEEFVIRNDGAGTDVQVIDDCSSADGWSLFLGAGNISSDGSKIRVNGTTDGSGYLIIQKTISVNLSTNPFVFVDITSSLGGSGYLAIGTDGQNYVRAQLKPVTAITEGALARIVIAIKAPGNVTETSSPTTVVGTPNWANVTLLRVGIKASANAAVTVDIDNITACNGTWAQVEVAVPDFIPSPNSPLLKKMGMFCYETATSAYTVKPALSWDYNSIVGSGIADAIAASGNIISLDGTNFVSMYGKNTGGTNYGRGGTLYPIGVAGESLSYSVNQTWRDPSAPSMTYSSVSGTQKRAGFALLMPPSDGGRTDINKVRLKLVTYYDADPSGNMGSTTYKLSNDNNASTGLQNLSKPWIALYDPAKTEIDFYLFTYRPKNLEFKRDESGTIHELKLFPGNGQIYHGRVTHCNPALDSDSNNIPDCIEASVEGSITKFLQAYGMVE